MYYSSALAHFQRAVLRAARCTCVGMDKRTRVVPIEGRNFSYMSDSLPPSKLEFFAVGPEFFSRLIK